MIVVVLLEWHKNIILAFNHWPLGGQDGIFFKFSFQFYFTDWYPQTYNNAFINATGPYWRQASIGSDDGSQQTATCPKVDLDLYHQLALLQQN